MANSSEGSVTADVDVGLANLLVDRLIETVDTRQPGHCLQVTDLPADLLDGLCQELRRLRPSCEAYVLSISPSRPWEVTATKLVERRNAGTAVIVVFLPPELRTAAEDSFDVTTFERFPLGDLYHQLYRRLLALTPNAMRSIIEEIVREARASDDLAICRYLMAILRAGVTHASIGESLHYLGLVPDPALLNDPATMRLRLSRNATAVDRLAASDEALFAKIQSLRLEEGRTPQALYHFFTAVGTSDPAHWLSRILDPRFAADLTFDHWEFRERISGEVEEVSVSAIGTTRRTPDGYPLVDVQHDRSLKVTWETTPAPLQCKGLQHFTVELMKDGVPVTEARTVKVGTSQRKERSTTLQNLQKLDLADGLYYLRVSAWALGSQLLQSAESESIFVRGSQGADVDDDDGTPTGAREKIFTVDSRYEAMLRAQVSLRERDKTLAELKKVDMAWVTPAGRGTRRATDVFVLKFNAANQYAIEVNATLRRVELETLADADSLGRWQLDLSRPAAWDAEPTLQPFAGIDYTRLEEFLLLRKDLFQRILNQPDYPGIPFLVETSDLSQWEGPIAEYAEAFLAVLDELASRLAAETDPAERQRILSANGQITTIDTIHLSLSEGRTAYLMAPTHPLKMLWALQYARLAQQWLSEMEALPSQQINWSTLDKSITRLLSLNVPNALVDGRGVLQINADNFGPFWSIFVPQDTLDVRALVERIKGLLGAVESDNHFTTVSGPDLARKVRQYLAQHPYVSTLCLNIVQPGSAAIVVEMLLDLQRDHPHLRYVVHLFSNEFQPEELGAALDELMSPTEKRSGQEELDAFVTASQNALFPKLVYSKHPLSDLLERARDFEAHLTLLFDAFAVEIGIGAPVVNRRSNHLHGLLFEYVEQFHTAGGQIEWRRQISPQPGVDLDGKHHIHDTLVRLYQRCSSVTAAVVSKGAYLEHVPMVHLPLSPEDKNLISQVHQVSDWVLTVDRNFGLEYLDSPYDEHCPVYLIDYQPEYLGDVGHRLIVSTQSASEVERIVCPVLEQHGLPVDTDTARALVNSLRSVSGRLVLKLMSSPQMASGAVGMALARLFLDQAQLQRDMVLIPLDAHPELFAVARQEAERLGQELTLRRTDMLLVEIDPDGKRLTFHLVEVKLRHSAGLAAGLDLKREIADQLQNSMQALRRLFDPHLTAPDRFDRLLRTQELASLLGFYLDRSVRYLLMSSKQGEVLHRLFDQLEGGYTLHFTFSGVVFNLSGSGYQTERDGEVTYHYLGLDRAEELLRAACVADGTGTPLPADVTYASTRRTFTQRPTDQGGDSSLTAAPGTPVRREVGGTQATVGTSSGGSAGTDLPAAVTPGLQPTLHLACDVILGTKHPTLQFGVLGKVAGQTFGLDLNGTNTISLFGVQGSGKSYTLGDIIEMAVQPIPGINQLPRPLAAVVFHYSKTEDYRPEFVSMTNPNNGLDAQRLREEYGAVPAGLNDVVLLTPRGKLAKRMHEFPTLPVHPITFDTGELDIEDWKFLMGVIGSDALYVKRITQILRRYRANLSLGNMYEGVAGANLSDAQTELARTRLEFAAEYIQDGHLLGKHLRPGRLVIVDLRDELIEKDEALGLFMVMLKLFANAQYGGQAFNKLIVFDEAHKYMQTAFIDAVVEVVREMRHKGTSVLIASQDPPSVPLPLIELSSQIILHQFSSPAWLKHIQKAATALNDLTAGKLNMLGKGQAYVWSREASMHEFETRAVKVDIRPRMTKHGGDTATAT